MATAGGCPEAASGRATAAWREAPVPHHRHRKDPHRQVYLIGRRFDHVFASTSLNPLSCTYLQKFRESGLSDHAALEAVFLPQS
jgi:endonuclease/exonuclease/phosphatase family metal-dependent hydrolase